MAFSATRLTCFALIAALEEDMRGAIEEFLGELAITELLPADRVTRAQARRQADGLLLAASLPGLLPYLDFGDSYEALMAYKESLPDELKVSLTAIGPRVVRLIAIRNRVAHTRPMEIDDSAHLLDTADALLAAARNSWLSLSETMERLTQNPSYVLSLTIDLPVDPVAGPQHNLPIPDFDETGFFGRKDKLRRIKKAIKGAYPVVSVLGDGGIGKTSLALKAAYELLEDSEQPFEAIVWVTAKATILTANEIQRINGAIESSLGLFARAATELSGSATEDPMGEVLAYLESFKILLILDNLETVLDARLREFLLDLPLGSKVIVTSRIGLGIENPIQLDPLTLDDSARLLRALARVRNVTQLKGLPQSAIESLAQKMNGHPAYIRWFVAGVQAGRRPEELVGDNALLLDFCMSNVYEFLTADARTVVRSMQVLSGARNQAELAFLNAFSAEKIQAALLELLTTNFVYMSSQASGQTLDTVYQLSEFGKQYLDKRHPVPSNERTRFLARSQELRALGSQLTAASSTSPYSTDTIDVRGLGDVHVARLLREAVRRADKDPAASLNFCTEAQVLAPSYYEAWRVEAYIRSVMQDHSGSLAAYERALELSPDSPALYFHYGAFLLDDAGDPRRGLEMLQAGARLDPESPALTGNIAWAHYCLGDMVAAFDSSRHVLAMQNTNQHEARASVVVALRSATAGLRAALDATSYEEAADFLELAVQLSEEVRVELLTGESYDRLIQLQELAQELVSETEGYTAGKAVEYKARFKERQRCADPESLTRETGLLKTYKSDKGFGFVTANSHDYFFHYRDLIDYANVDQLSERITCAFEPILTSPRGPRAQQVRILT
jgi:tetratricopeptide (TPR) repeat protein/cold shock CspA family protein